MDLSGIETHIKLFYPIMTESSQLDLSGIETNLNMKNANKRTFSQLDLSGIETEELHALAVQEHRLSIGP